MPTTPPLLGIILAAVGLSTLTLPVAAASFDCAKAASRIEHAICTNSELSALDDRLADRFAAATARSLDPAGLADDQRNWRAIVDRDATDDDRLLEAYRRRIDQLDRELAWLDKVEPTRDMTEAAAHSACPPLFDVGAGSCEVAEFGDVGTIEGHAFLYGLYGFRTAPGDDPYRVAVIVYARDGERLRALYAPRDDGSFYGKPKIIVAADRTILQLPGYESGTGNFNRERLFAWRGGAWAVADVTSWDSDILLHVPGGYEAWKGIFPDYVRMTASTPLWRKKTDGNCCPTGGRADFTLAWHGDRLVIKSTRVKLGAKAASQF